LQPVKTFAVGQLYTNDQIRFTLGLENLGGIRPSVDSQGRLKHLAIMTSELDCDRSLSENPYADRIEDGVLLYTAAGREGDQKLSGRNKRLIEQYDTPTPFFGFSNVGRQVYRFLGLLELVRHYRDVQADIRGKIRSVWMFEFRIHSALTEMPVDDARLIALSFFQNKTSQEDQADEDPVPSAISQLPESEVEQVRSKLLALSPLDFERFTGRFFELSGFKRVHTTSFQGDGGIDLEAYVDGEDLFFGGTHIQAQVKRWRHTVSNVEINGFRGALASTAKGVFISTGYFSRAATQEATLPFKPTIALIDGRRLAMTCLKKACLP